MQNEGLIEEAVIAPSPTPLATLDAVALRCRPTLSEWIERACRWPAPVGEWNFGDYHRLEVSFSPKRGRRQHLQFCFELRGLVGIEIWRAQGKSAEHRRPTSDQVSALKRLGYYFDSEMGHFRKSVPVGSREAVQTLAKEAVEVLYSALGYRGQSELKIEYQEASRARLARVVTGLTRGDLAMMGSLVGWEPFAVPDGIMTEQLTEEQPEVFCLRRGDAMMLVGLSDPQGGVEGYGAGFFCAAFGVPPGIPPELRRSLQKRLFCGFLRWEEGDVVTLTHYFSLRGGVTLFWLLDQLTDFIDSCAEIDAALKTTWHSSKRAGKHDRKKPAPASGTKVHSFRRKK